MILARCNPESSSRNDTGSFDDTGRIFLCGDVMTGRGLDQILPSPCPPDLYEDYVSSAEQYVQLASEANGPIPRKVGWDYIWGDVLGELRRRRPHVSVINLETSITRSGKPVPKGINYRMSPENAECLRSLGADCCILANNHVLDWGEPGLIETLSTLDRLKIKFAGAGKNLAQAQNPAVIEIADGRRVLVFGCADISSGTPESWAATATKPGVNVIPGLTRKVVVDIAQRRMAIARPGDIAVVSIHWGPNWGYEVDQAQRQFAHDLIEIAGVSIVHGHSSHHAKAIEIFQDRLILYGCGDFINDYEGIAGPEGFRDDLPLMYFADIAKGGSLLGLEVVPFRLRRFQLAIPSQQETDWLLNTLSRECAKFGAQVSNNPRDHRPAFSLKYPTKIRP
jgi:poly-gamma-glutamate capsule biosynthesis protein CapA/YwtB (metallophosphatase superfamily)